MATSRRRDGGALSRCHFFGFFGSGRRLHGDPLPPPPPPDDRVRGHTPGCPTASDSDDTPHVRAAGGFFPTTTPSGRTRAEARCPDDACERGGNAEALSALLGSLNVSVDTKADGDTPLHVACLYGHADIVRALLETNADPRVTDGDGGTPLHDASAGGHLNIVKMSVERIRERARTTISVLRERSIAHRSSERRLCTWRLEASTVRWLR